MARLAGAEARLQALCVEAFEAIGGSGWGRVDLLCDAGGEPWLIERYFYRELEINPGLQDIDFDPDNPDYDYP